jgi:hypothetical protein
MNDEREIKIKLSKRKLTLLLVGSIIFVGLGVLLIINPAKFRDSIFQNTTLVFGAGLLSILFFGFVGIFIFKKLCDKQFGLIITDEGIFDNSSAVSAGQIFWSDVSAIKVIEVFNQKFIMLIVEDPEQYIDRQTSTVKRKAMQMNFKNFGSPIGISANGLQCNFQELKNILEKKFTEFKKNKSFSLHIDCR